MQKNRGYIKKSCNTNFPFWEKIHMIMFKEILQPGHELTSTEYKVFWYTSVDYILETIL